MRISLPRRRAFVLASLLLVPLAMMGCGGGGGPAVYPVTGKVTADGNPLSKGSVRFIPDATKSNASPHESAGTIGADGTYTIYTNGKAGAPLGWYKVTVVSSEEPDSTKPNAVKSYVAKRFATVELTKLTIEVKADAGAGAYDLAVSAQ